MAAKTKRTNIYNLTDVQDRPRPLTIFRVRVPPGGRLVVPVSKIAGPIHTARLARMQKARDIHVGATPPAWYVRRKREIDQQRRAAQAYKPPGRPEPAERDEVDTGDAAVDYTPYLEAMRKMRTKKDVLAFAKYVRPAPLLSDRMKLTELKDAVDLAVEGGSKLTPLTKLDELLE